MGRTIAVFSVRLCTISSDYCVYNGEFNELSELLRRSIAG